MTQPYKSFKFSRISQFYVTLIVFFMSSFCALAGVLEKEEKKSYAQFKQDVFIKENFFKNTKKGVFVDIGASDGITLSNTYLFEKEYGWIGICFEPRPDKFEELVKNRECLCINGCVADTAGEQPFLFLQGYTGDLSGLVASYDPQHLDRIKHELLVRGGTHELIKTPCFLLNDILKGCGIRHVDFLSIDTEGSELAILRSIAFNEVTIDIIDVENNYAGPAIEHFLKTKGYELVVKLGCDELYRRKK